MTPPLPLGPSGGPVPIPPVSEIGRADDAAPADQPIVRPGDHFVRMDNSDSDSYKTVADLLNALGDEQLFGTVANAKYQPERNKKYLKVTVAILEIKKLLRGDEKNSAYAVQKIEAWLSDPELLGDTVVAHQARLNLIKVLKRAPKGAGIDDAAKELLAALQKNYSTKAPDPKDPPKETPKAKEAPKDTPKAEAKSETKDTPSLSEALTDAKLFGDKFSSYDKERNKKYLAVTTAILEIKKIARGDESNPATAKAKIEAWLGDSTLLTDSVAHQGRVGLIKALEAAPKGGDAYNQAIATLIAALRADYSKAGAPAKKEEAPASDVKAKTSGTGLAQVTVNPKGKVKEKREDDTKSFASGLNNAVKPAMGRLLKKYNSVNVKCDMTVSIDGDGKVITVEFTNLKLGEISTQDAQDLFDKIAQNLRARFRFKPMGGSDINIIKTPLSIIGQ